MLHLDLPGIRKIASGKVREIFDLGEHLLFVATDRISAFDVVMRNGIPGKGRILTQLSLFWFQLLGDCGPNHLITADLARMPASVQRHAAQLAGRSMLVEPVDDHEAHPAPSHATADAEPDPRHVG